MALCECGCGQETPVAKVTNQYGVKGEPRRCVPGHRSPRLDYYRDYRKEKGPHLAQMRRAACQRVKLEALCHYGGDPPRCACCGEAQIEFLTFDHIEGDGAEERRNDHSLVGVNMARKLKREGWPAGFRVLCWNCNSARGCYGYCPHELR